MSNADAFGLFVSAVEGKPVHRFGAPNVLIGADRDPEEPRKIRYDTNAVVAIPKAEAQRYSREYLRLIAEGALVERSAEDFERQSVSESTEVGAPREPLEPRAPAEERVSDGTTDGGRQQR